MDLRGLEHVFFFFCQHFGGRSREGRAEEESKVIRSLTRCLAEMSTINRLAPTDDLLFLADGVQEVDFKEIGKLKRHEASFGATCWVCRGRVLRRRRGVELGIWHGSKVISSRVQGTGRVTGPISTVENLHDKLKQAVLAMDSVHGILHGLLSAQDFFHLRAEVIDAVNGISSGNVNILGSSVDVLGHLMACLDHVVHADDGLVHQAFSAVSDALGAARHVVKEIVNLVGAFEAACDSGDCYLSESLCGDGRGKRDVQNVSGFRVLISCGRTPSKVLYRASTLS